MDDGETFSTANLAKEVAIGAVSGAAGGGIGKAAGAAGKALLGKLPKLGKSGGTPLYRGVPEGHHVYDEALSGSAWPGDILGHSDGAAHALGMTDNSALTSWSKNIKVAIGFGTKGGTTPGVLLRTTLEEQAHRVVPGPDQLGEAEVLLRGVVSGVKTRRLPL